MGNKLFWAAEIHEHFIEGSHNDVNKVKSYNIQLFTLYLVIYFLLAFKCKL